MIRNLPYTVVIDGKEYAITNKCDYRVVLDCISALNDTDFTPEQSIECALRIFYADLTNASKLQKIIPNLEEATKQMYQIIAYDETKNTRQKPNLIDWDFDFQRIISPINKALGYDARLPDKYTHWWSFVSAYMEIGDCSFSRILSIRDKRLRGEKLDKWERKYYNENIDIINLPNRLTSEQEEWLFGE